MKHEPPTTFHEATAVARTLRPRLDYEIETGICVVGGGLAGLWTARGLIRRGFEVIVLEGGQIGGGASGRNGGLVSAGYAERLPRIIDRVGLDHARALYALSRAGVEMVRGVLAEGELHLDPVPGRLNVLRYDDEEGLRRQAELLATAFDHDVVVWPTERVREALKTDRYYQGLHEPDAFSIHPLNLALGLAAEIERGGGRIFEQSVAIEADFDGVRKWVATASGRVRAQQIVFCGSAFIGRGFPALARTVLPVSTYVGVSAPAGDRLARAIRYAGGVVDTRRAGDYYRVTGDRLLWGGRITARSTAPRNLRKLIAGDILRVYPQLAGIEIEYAWPGVMGYAIHKMPQIGQLRPGVWIASAFGGHGLNTTAIAGELIATAIAERDDRWRLFGAFGLVWAGGAVGKRVTELVYRSMRLRDWYDETHAHVAERWDVHRREFARKRAERLAAAEKALAERRLRVAAEMRERLALKVEAAARQAVEAAKRAVIEAAEWAKADAAAARRAESEAAERLRGLAVKRAGAAASTQAGEVAKRLTAAERAAAAKAEAARKAAARKARAAAAAERMQRARHSIKAGVVTTADALGRAAGRLAQWSKRLGERAARTGARLSEEFAARQRVARAQAGPQLERARRSIKSGVEQAGESIGRGAGRLAGWSKRMGERASEAGARLAKEIAERRAAARHETKATAESVEKKSAPAEDAANRGVAPAVVLLDAENPRTVKVTAGKKKVRKPHPKKSGRK